MELKSLQDWTLEKQLKSVPGVVDVSSFGGMTREYQVRVDPDKLIAYGVSISQLEQQLSANNINAGGSFIEQGQQQVNVREVGLVSSVRDIEQVILKTPERHAGSSEGCRARLPRAQDPSRADGYAIHKVDGKIVDEDDIIGGIVLLLKGADEDPTLDGIHEKIKELNQQILPKGVKIVPYLDRSDLVHYTTHTVMHNLSEGIFLVVIILFLFLGNVRGAIIVSLTMPFALLFAAICLDLRHVPANLLSLGALDFGMFVDGTMVMIENILRHLGHHAANGHSPREKIRIASHEVQRPVFYARGIVITAYLLSSPCRPWRVGFSSLWRGRSRLLCWLITIFNARSPRAGKLRLQQGRKRMAQPFR